MACRKHSPGNPCCCPVSPAMIEHISFNGVDKVPSQWNASSVSNCCPYVEWAVPSYDGYGGVLLIESQNQNTTECLDVFGINNHYYCVRAYVQSIRFYFSKFSCGENWWVAMAVTITVNHTRGPTAGVCGILPGGTGTVTLYREKFVPSIAAGTTITFTADDHYDWTDPESCHERSSCPDEYTGEISTTSYYCCGTILDPNCSNSGWVNPVTIDFTTCDFSFIIS